MAISPIQFNFPKDKSAKDNVVSVNLVKDKILIQKGWPGISPSETTILSSISACDNLKPKKATIFDCDNKSSASSSDYQFRMADIWQVVILMASF